MVHFCEPEQDIAVHTFYGQINLKKLEWQNNGPRWKYVKVKNSYKLDVTSGWAHYPKLIGLQYTINLSYTTTFAYFLNFIISPQRK